MHMASNAHYDDDDDDDDDTPIPADHHTLGPYERYIHTGTQGESSLECIRACSAHVAFAASRRHESCIIGH